MALLKKGLRKHGAGGAASDRSQGSHSSQFLVQKWKEIVSKSKNIKNWFVVLRFVYFSGFSQRREKKSVTRPINLLELMRNHPGTYVYIEVYKW